ncbi:MAG TPA: EpsI family protein [Phycisphaerales bacterium]|nr:EpsI family protein [Phycisphaerales bacterium]
MKIENQNPRPVIIAAITASFLMLVLGMGYRVLDSRLSGPGNASPISFAMLERFPMQVGYWTGTEVPLDEEIVRATDTDAHINRRYSRNNGLEFVSLYIATGVKARDLMPHRPEVCYTGAGWTLTDKRSVELPLEDGTILPCNVMQFSRGVLTIKKVVVLDYYIVDDEYCRDVSLLRSKAWKGSGTVRYVAQVQIVTSIQSNQTAASATKSLSTFAVESASSISTLFEDIEEGTESGNDSVDANGTVGSEEARTIGR